MREIREQNITHIAINKNGSILAVVHGLFRTGSFRQFLDIYNEKEKLMHMVDTVTNLAVSPSGKSVATIECDKYLYIRHVKRNEIRKEIEHRPEYMYYISDKYIVLFDLFPPTKEADEHAIYTLIDTETGKTVIEHTKTYPYFALDGFVKHDVPYLYIQGFHPMIYNMLTGKVEKEYYDEGNKPTFGMSVVGDKILSANEGDNHVSIWNMNQSETQVPMYIDTLEDGIVIPVTNRDVSKIACRTEEQVSVYDVKENKLLCRIKERLVAPYRQDPVFIENTESNAEPVAEPNTSKLWYITTKGLHSLTMDGKTSLVVPGTFSIDMFLVNEDRTKGFAVKESEEKRGVDTIYIF